MIEGRREGDWSILSVKGEVDVYTAPKLREELIKLVEARKYRIIVDLEGVEFLDSTGLAVLVGGLNRFKENNGILAICCTKDQILRVFSLTGLNKVFPIHETIEAATASG